MSVGWGGMGGIDRVQCMYLRMFILVHTYMSLVCVLVRVRVREWKYKTKKSHPSVHFHQSSSFYHLRARSRISRIKAIYKIFQTDRSSEFFIILWESIVRILLQYERCTIPIYMYPACTYIYTVYIYCQTFRWFFFLFTHTFSFSELSHSLSTIHTSHIPKKDRARASGYSCLVCTCTFHVCVKTCVLLFSVDTDLEYKYNKKNYTYKTTSSRSSLDRIPTTSSSLR